MSTKSAQKSIIDAKLPKNIEAALESLAKGLGVGAVELWSIFVRQYVVKGLVQVFTALVLIAVGVFIAFQFQYWALIPFAFALTFCYPAILLLGNPKYYAIQDITKKIKTLK